MDNGWMGAMVFLLIAGFAICCAGGAEGAVVGILLCGVAAAVIVKGIKKNRGIAEIRQQTDIVALTDNSIKIERRTMNNARLLSVKAHRDMTIRHRPEELVYTSATVGGVTTGGFHVLPEEKTTMVGEKTGKYYITFCDYNDESKIVQSIYIQPDMVDSIKRNPVVCQFLDASGKCLELKHKASEEIPDFINKAALEYHAAGRWDMAEKLLRPYTDKTRLSKEECDAVVAWICGR